MTTRPAPTECHCIPCVNTRRRELWRAAGWSVLAVVCIYSALWAIYLIGV